MSDPRPTLKAVARRAGVSVSTASLVFSGRGPVSKPTADKVRAAAGELSYLLDYRPASGKVVNLFRE